ncbi:MAG: GGDEF domain-containing protein [Psychromonas sp.]|nr:GGDEF domain-containing protein [Psychromonas sp.]
MLDKLLYFDTTLVFDTYIDCLLKEVESAKNKAERYAHSLEDKVAERTQQLKELSQCDPLTDIYNQRAMFDFLRRELLMAKRNQTKLSVIYFDIDKFKLINDKEGHLKGDEVLKAISGFLLQTIRETDLACRYGGDEFCVILPDCDAENAQLICGKIINHFVNKYPNYSLSMGVSETGGDKWCLGEEIIRQADEKMYFAKKEKGSQIRF